MRVVLVSRVRLNPYVDLLAQGLAAGHDGLQVTTAGTWSLPWLIRQRSRIDLVHLHWLELFYTYPSAYLSAKRWLSSVAAIMACRRLGIGLVATVHNVSAHDGRWRPHDTWANRLLYRRADALHVHDVQAQREVVGAGADRRRVAVIPHGTYVGAYPDACTREEARRRLGLPQQAMVYLSLGLIRPYKGLEALIQAFAALDRPQARLVIAGQVQDPGYAAQLADLASGDVRVNFNPGYVPDDMLQHYFRAADVAVLPYRAATTSGAAYLAFSFEVPLIAPRLGPFPELAADGRGVLYDPEAEGSLLLALRTAFELDIEAARTACRAFNDAHDWQRLARRHAALYRFALGRSSAASAGQAVEDAI